MSRDYPSLVDKLKDPQVSARNPGPASAPRALKYRTLYDNATYYAKSRTTGSCAVYEIAGIVSAVSPKKPANRELALRKPRALRKTGSHRHSKSGSRIFQEVPSSSNVERSKGPPWVGQSGGKGTNSHFRFFRRGGRGEKWVTILRSGAM